MTDRDKLKSVIAYIAAKRPGLGKLKLFKLLFLTDFTAHAQMGHSLTGEMYENFDMGPVPRTLWTNFEAIVLSCVKLDHVETAPGMLPEQQMTPSPHFRPELGDDERAHIDAVLDRFGGWSGEMLKQHTHKQLPYLATPRGEAIPYGLAEYLDFQRPTPAEAERLRGNARLMEDLRQAVLRKQRTA